MKYAWIAKHVQLWPVAKLCRTLKVSASGFKAWRGGGKRSTQRLSDAQLLVAIHAIHAKLKGAYGSPRMHEELRERGYRVGKARVERLINQLNLGHIRTTRGYALSGGERRRVEIARALCIQPSFILLDEPFSGIDPIAVSELQKIIFDMKASGIGVLITDHSVRETLRVTDRAYIIAEGRIFRAGTPHELGNDPDVRRIYLGEGFSLG